VRGMAGKFSGRCYFTASVSRDSMRRFQAASRFNVMVSR